MRICHITSAHLEEDGRIFRRECVSLANAGFDVFLVQRGESYNKLGVTIAGFGKAEPNRLKRMLFTARKAYISARKTDADVYHMHDPELLRYALRLKRAGKKVIFDSHENYCDQIKCKPYLPKSVAKVLSAVYTNYERFVLNRIDGVVIPCLKNGEYWLNANCRHRIVSNNVPWLSEMFDKYDKGIQKENHSMCMVGNLTKARGISELTIVANQIECRNYIAGGGNEEYLSELAKLNESGHTVFLGVISHEEVRELIQRCEIGIATILNVGQYNTADNLPTKVYEYMSLGVPVILTKAKYNMEVVEKYQFGICVDPTNIEEFANAISYLFSHDEIRKQMGANGRQAVQDTFNWDKEQNSLIQMYRSMEEEIKARQT